VALRSGGTLYWLLNDHLGSTAVTLSGATEAGEVRYRAFGATRFTSGTTPTSVRFTGQREEAALGLYFYVFVNQKTRHLIIRNRVSWMDRTLQ
jgi:hypothetical protein